MEVAGRPLGTNWLEANLANVLVAVLLPKSTTVGMSVQGFFKVEPPAAALMQRQRGVPDRPAKPQGEIAPNMGSP